MFTQMNVLAGLVLVAAAAPVENGLQGKELAATREASRDLVREIENLQEDVVEATSGQRERGLYRRAEAALCEAERFHKSLGPGPTRGGLAKMFDGVDVKVHELLKEVLALDNQPALKLSAGRVARAGQRLHFALFAGDPSRERVKGLIIRSTKALAADARQLEQVGQYGLGAEQGHGVLIGDLRKFRVAAEAFEKQLDGSDLERLRREFAAVNAAWERVARGLAKIKPGDGLLLLRTAERLDELHEQLFQRLGVKGKRTALTART